MNNHDNIAPLDWHSQKRYVFFFTDKVFESVKKKGADFPVHEHDTRALRFYLIAYKVWDALENKWIKYRHG